MPLRCLPWLAALLIACPQTAPVVDAPGALVADLRADRTEVLVGESVLLDASASVDRHGIEASFSDSAIEEFQFEFGDGTTFLNDTFFMGHAWTEAGTFVAAVTVREGEHEARAELAITVRHPPPVLLGIDAGGDRRAAIGERIALMGRQFRADNLPDVAFDGVPATRVEFESEYAIRVAVPPTTPSGPTLVDVDFPDAGDAILPLEVVRYALVTDAYRGRVSVLEMGAWETVELSSQTVELPSAANVVVSADGAIALVGDARFQAAAHPTVLVLDLTADWGPAVLSTLTAGEGPLHGLSLARDVPQAVVCDLSGFTMVDLTDPASPVLGAREAFAFGDMAPAGVALSDDGTRLAVLSTFNDRLRFYSITPAGPVYEDEWIGVGPGAMALIPSPGFDGTVALGGGGPGAIPPDLDLGNSTLTAVDLSAWPASLLGDGPAGLGAPVPIDAAFAPSGAVVVSTFDQNFGQIGGALGDIVGDPTDLGAWTDLVESITGLGFGSVQVRGPREAGYPLEDELFAPYGFVAGVDLRFDERVFVGSAVHLGTTIEFLNGDDLLRLSLDLEYSVAVGDLITGDIDLLPLYTAPVVSYVDFVLQYDVEPVLQLVLPPFALGQAAIQP